MPYCNVCKVSISTKTDRCPLCHARLDSGTTDAMNAYPRYEPIKDRHAATARNISAAALTLMALSVFLNMFILTSGYWSAIACAAIAYTWLLGLISFNEKIPLGIKLVSHAISIPVLLVVINLFSADDQAMDVTWAISYAIPFIILGFILSISVLTMIRKYKLGEYVVSQFALCGLGFIPLIIILCKAARPLYPSIITASCSCLSILYLIVFSRETVRLELDRRFYV
jgi:hypothetical protein